MKTFFENNFQLSMDIAKILAETRANKGFNKSEMARQLGISSQLYGQYERGDVEPKTDFRKKFEDLFGISLIENENLSSNIEASPSLTEGDLIRMKKAFGGRERKGIMYVPIPAQAGYSKNFLDPVYMSELGRWRIEGLPYEGDRFRVFQVKGPSMEYLDAGGKPQGFFEGMDIVAEIVEPEDWKTGQIPPYHVYVIVMEDEILIKRILIKEDGTYIMHSDNPSERPRQKILRKEDIKELWYVKRKLDWGMAPPEKIEIEI